MMFPIFKSKHELFVPTTAPKNQQGELLFKNPQPRLRKLVKNTNAYVSIDSPWVLNVNKK